MQFIRIAAFTADRDSISIGLFCFPFRRALKLLINTAGYANLLIKEKGAPRSGLLPPERKGTSPNTGFL